MRKHEPEFAIIAHDVPLWDKQEYAKLEHKANQVWHSFKPKKGWICPLDVWQRGQMGLGA